jgi:hypothetical protein
LQTVTASETNAAGLTGSSSLTFTYESVAPKVTVALADDTSGGKHITFDDALTGTADANATVKIIGGGSIVLGTATANASGVWSFTPTTLPQGLQNIIVTNAAGLTGYSSVTFTYDTVAPKVTIALANDTSGGNDITTNDALTGTADANATVKISEGSTVLGTTTANASGVWSFTPTGLAAGLHTITASETDAAKLTGSSSLTFTLANVSVAASTAVPTGHGNSAETFLFRSNLGNETINNFNVKHEVIDLPHSEVADFAAVQADLHAVGNSAVLTLDAADSITLPHLQIQSLHAQNFHFF